MIYFDNAATTYKKPQAVIDAVCQALSGCGNAGRGVNEASVSASELAFETRCLIAELCHASDPAQVAFTSNSTEALNIAISGTLKAGDHAITTMLEHNSVLRPLYRLEDMGMELSIVEADSQGRINYDDFAEKLRPHTKAIICTHASNLTGNILHIQQIGKFAKEHGLLFIVDASQTAGVFTIDMDEQNIDILCITGHKSLMGPQGTGAIVVREGVEIAPLKTGGSGIHTFDRHHPQEMPTKLEAGTLNMHGIAGLNAAIKHIQAIGIDKIREREQTLARRFYEGISDLKLLRVYGDFSTWDRAPIVSINIGDYDSSLVSDALMTRFSIQTRSGGHCAPLMHKALGTEKQGAVRFSFNYYNTENEVDTAIRALHELTN
ncbi:MAG: aminotransferase class V-fold PLP-dependent enzyme [bacterium]|nr:aminotransferase class V-fold PLP-dependent enzyme [bacterium]